MTTTQGKSCRGRKCGVCGISVQEEIKVLEEMLAAREKEQAELSHAPDVSEEELTVLAGLSVFDIKAIRVLVKKYHSI